MDRTLLDMTFNLAMKVSDRTQQVAKYINDNNIETLWTEAVREARQAAGVISRVTFWNAEVAQSRVSYELDLSEGNVTFTGTDPDGDEHTYTIPTDFLFPETRPAALEALRLRYLTQVVAEQIDASTAATAKRAADEREFERLGRELGKI